jgi:uncharacterized cupredoxin-like copper-binding protein
VHGAARRVTFRDMRGMMRWGLVVLLLAMGLGACGDDDDPSDEGAGDSSTTTSAEVARSEVHEVDFSAKEYSYSSIEDAKSGTVRFTMKNDGKELHIAALARIKDGKSFGDVAKELQASTPPSDPASEEIGGIASTSPGLSSSVTMQLEPGSYFFACYIPTADGSVHVAKGMVLPFEVQEDEAEPAALETAAGTVTAKDFSYTTDYKVKAGEQVIALKNEGGQGHEITLLEFEAGKGPADLEAYFAKPEGPLPATFYGGPVIKVGGKASWETPRFEAGKSYFFMCLIPDPADGVPHAAKGMVLPVQVT